VILTKYRLLLGVYTLGLFEARFKAKNLGYGVNPGIVCVVSNLNYSGFCYKLVCAENGWQSTCGGGFGIISCA